LIQLSAENRPTPQILHTQAFVVYALDELKLNFRQQNGSGVPVNPTLLQLQNNSMESRYFTPITSEQTKNEPQKGCPFIMFR
jgi:hypothetical protein